MKKIKYLLVILLSVFNCNIEAPTQFSEEALNDVFTTLSGNQVTLKSILEKHEGKTIVIDIWASWCSDCIKGMPKVKALQKKYNDAVYLFFSLDRGERPWKRGIKKYQIEGEHYYMPSGKKSAFGDFVKIRWIPRYMVINKDGNIELFKATEADDNKLVNALKK